MLDGIYLQEFLACYSNCVGRVGYEYGAKAPSPGCDSHDFSVLDCSGDVAWVIDRCGSGWVRGLKGGSQEMGLFLEDCDLSGSWSYATAVYDFEPKSLYIAVLRETANRPGHVWFVYDGLTRECCAGYGVCARSPSRVPLISAYVWTEIPVLLGDCPDYADLAREG